MDNITSTPRFSALILAGGQSSRMGQDKAQLLLNGQSLLQHMQQLASAAGASELLLSRNQPGYIEDTVPQAGPLAGILAALDHCSSPLLLVLPIDTPLLSSISLQRLLQQAMACNNAAHFEQSPLPCVLPVNAELKALITRQLQQGQRSVKALLAGLNAIAMAAPATELLNTNTPQDWQLCLNLFNNGEHYAKA
ncbi:molybdopterin-guanine dinucleotide biosynthesis protein A [Arsukibacterium ikkense]|uniref:Molybdenum cofactor guanylyltransferase n=1 Tax=Arsukibacterium ikkense TaxID=336831 RepID=A0A0M2V5V4_9GAMM|nr:molybdenum cofactor guanylyltransferase [Arsukibacterium ikkense]KKO46026.1 molybdopterin-guanine dinucleotide biosynthesis protein A [Arsukibacterium ikkense]